MNDLIPVERIENRIYLIRGQKVMLDEDLAGLYGVETFVLNQAVKRNIERFPEDFMFRLNKQENEQIKVLNLKSQIVISSLSATKAGWGGRRKLPYAFTEQGIAMLSGVLRSKRAVQVNIAIMRIFVRLRRILSSHKKLAQKVKELEQRMGKYDGEVKDIFNAIKKMMAPEIKPKRIGFLK